MRKLAIAAAAALALCGGAQAQSRRAAQGRARPGHEDHPGPAGPGQGARRAKGQGVPPRRRRQRRRGCRSRRGAPVVSPGTRAEDGAPDADQARIEVYGQVMPDAIYDFKRMNPEWAATLRPSQIPIVCPGSPGCGEDGAVHVQHPPVEPGRARVHPHHLGLIKTDLAFDLFGTDGSTSIHWLRIWAEMGMFGVGQYYSNFMDIERVPQHDRLLGSAAAWCSCATRSSASRR